jgi:hypothetical protein
MEIFKDEQRCKYIRRYERKDLKRKGPFYRRGKRRVDEEISCLSVCL